MTARPGAGTGGRYAYSGDGYILLRLDARAEAAFPALVASILGETGVRWRSEYGAMRFWAGPR